MNSIRKTFIAIITLLFILGLCFSFINEVYAATGLEQGEPKVFEGNDNPPGAESVGKIRDVVVTITRIISATIALVTILVLGAPEKGHGGLAAHDGVIGDAVGGQPAQKQSCQSGDGGPVQLVPGDEVTEEGQIVAGEEGILHRLHAPGQLAATGGALQGDDAGGASAGRQVIDEIGQQEGDELAATSCLPGQRRAVLSQSPVPALIRLQVFRQGLHGPSGGFPAEVGIGLSGSGQLPHVAENALVVRCRVAPQPGVGGEETGKGGGGSVQREPPEGTAEEGLHVLPAPDGGGQEAGLLLRELRTGKQSAVRAAQQTEAGGGPRREAGTGGVLGMAAHDHAVGPAAPDGAAVRGGPGGVGDEDGLGLDAQAGAVGGEGDLPRHLHGESALDRRHPQCHPLRGVPDHQNMALLLRQGKLPQHKTQGGGGALGAAVRQEGVDILQADGTAGDGLGHGGKGLGQGIAAIVRVRQSPGGPHVRADPLIGIAAGDAQQALLDEDAAEAAAAGHGEVRTAGSAELVGEEIGPLVHEIVFIGIEQAHAHLVGAVLDGGPLQDELAPALTAQPVQQAPADVGYAEAVGGDLPSAGVQVDPRSPAGIYQLFQHGSAPFRLSGGDDMILGEEPHQGIQDPMGTDVPEDLVLGGLDAETGYAEEAYGLEVALHHPDEFLAVVLRALTAVLDEPGADLPVHGQAVGLQEAAGPQVGALPGHRGVAELIEEQVQLGEDHRHGGGDGLVHVHAGVFADEVGDGGHHVGAVVELEGAVRVRLMAGAQDRLRRQTLAETGDGQGVDQQDELLGAVDVADDPLLGVLLILAGAVEDGQGGGGPVVLPDAPELGDHHGVAGRGADGHLVAQDEIQVVPEGGPGDVVHMLDVQRGGVILPVAGAQLLDHHGQVVGLAGAGGAQDAEAQVVPVLLDVGGEGLTADVGRAAVLSEGAQDRQGPAAAGGILAVGDGPPQIEGTQSQLVGVAGAAAALAAEGEPLQLSDAVGTDQIRFHGSLAPFGHVGGQEEGELRVGLGDHVPQQGLDAPGGVGGAGDIAVSHGADGIEVDRLEVAQGVEDLVELVAAQELPAHLVPDLAHGGWILPGTPGRDRPAHGLGTQLGVDLRLIGLGDEHIDGDGIFAARPQHAQVDEVVDEAHHHVLGPVAAVAVGEHAVLLPPRPQRAAAEGVQQDQDGVAVAQLELLLVAGAGVDAEPLAGDIVEGQDPAGASCHGHQQGIHLRVEVRGLGAGLGARVPALQLVENGLVVLGDLQAETVALCDLPPEQVGGGGQEHGFARVAAADELEDHGTGVGGDHFRLAARHRAVGLKTAAPGEEGGGQLGAAEAAVVPDAVGVGHQMPVQETALGIAAAESRHPVGALVDRTVGPDMVDAQKETVRQTGDEQDDARHHGDGEDDEQQDEKDIEADEETEDRQADDAGEVIDPGEHLHGGPDDIVEIRLQRDGVPV